MQLGADRMCALVMLNTARWRLPTIATHGNWGYHACRCLVSVVVHFQVHAYMLLQSVTAWMTSCCMLQISFAYMLLDTAITQQQVMVCDTLFDAAAAYLY